MDSPFHISAELDQPLAAWTRVDCLLYPSGVGVTVLIRRAWAKTALEQNGVNKMGSNKMEQNGVKSALDSKNKMGSSLLLTQEQLN